MISVCVAYWERQAELDQMFETYRRAYGGRAGEHEIEFSVCDDGSPVPARVPEGVVLTRLPTKSGPLNPCVPLNRAVAASSGEIVVLTNAEIEHTGATLLRMLELLEGPNDYVTASCWDDRGFWVAHPSVNFSERGRLPMPPDAQFHFLAMLSRGLWEKSGGFDEEYRHVQGCDDNDFAFRLQRAGARFRCAVKSPVMHRHSKTRWGLPHGRDLFLKKWPEATRG